VLVPIHAPDGVADELSDLVDDRRVLLRRPAGDDIHSVEAQQIEAATRLLTHISIDVDRLAFRS
jgi:hypothetical protein